MGDIDRSEFVGVYKLSVSLDAIDKEFVLSKINKI